MLVPNKLGEKAKNKTCFWQPWYT